MSHNIGHCISKSVLYFLTPKHGEVHRVRLRRLSWLGHLSPEQEQALKEFKGTLPEAQLAQFDDAYLLRFLRARKFKLKDVAKMWGDFIEWRKKNNVDTITVPHR